MAKHHETRSHAIIRYLDAYKRATGKSWPTVATDVADCYFKQYNAAQRTVDFRLPGHSGKGDEYEDMRHNAQTLNKFRNEEWRMPSDIEESILMALPEPWHSDLKSELANRVGCMAVPIITMAPMEDMRGIARLLKESSEAVLSLTKMVDDDDVITAADREHAEEALRELDDVMAAAYFMKMKIRTHVLIETNVKPGQPLKAVK